jgi:hypothetical protein
MTRLFQAVMTAALVVSVSHGAASAQSAETPSDAPLKVKPVKPHKPIKNPAEAAEAEKVLESYAECVAKAGGLLVRGDVPRYSCRTIAAGRFGEQGIALAVSWSRRAHANGYRYVSWGAVHCALPT